MTTSILRPASPQSEGEGDDATSMEALLAGKSKGVVTLRRGDVVEGVVMRIDRDEVLLDVGAKSEGVLPLHEARSLSAEKITELKVGDTLLVYVVRSEDSEGSMALSVDRALGERGWLDLQKSLENGALVTGKVTGCNRGGLLVEAVGVNGFIPLSQLATRPMMPTEGQVENPLSAFVGRELQLKVLELNRRRNRLILSERAAVQEWRSQQREKLLGEIQEGQVQKGRVTGIRDFGVFVDLGGIEGLIRLSELAWGRLASPEELVKLGQEVEVLVLKLDREAKKIALSLRRAQSDSWGKIVGKFREGQVVSGTITKLAPFGAFAQIEGGVEGLIHISELSDRRIGHPKEIVKEGEVFPLKILRIEPERQRLGLSLKQAHQEEPQEIALQTQPGEAPTPREQPAEGPEPHSAPITGTA